MKVAMTDKTLIEMDTITEFNLFITLRDVIKELKKQGYEFWQIEEYLKLHFEKAEYYLYNQLI